MMSIYWNDQRISSDKKLKKIGAPKGVPLRIVQKKLPIDNIQGVSACPQEVDPLSQEKGVVKMSCGHKIGRTSLMKIVNDAIREKKAKVTCPLVLYCQEWSFE